MHRSLLPSLLCGLLLVTAGCSGLAGDKPNQDFSVTPVDVPTDEPTPNYPPGVSEEGVDDSLELIQAHVDVISNESFSLSSNRSTVVVSSADNALIYESWFRASVDGSRRNYLTHSYNEGTLLAHNKSVQNIYYANGERAYWKRLVDNSSSVRLVRTPNGGPKAPSDALPYSFTNRDTFSVLNAAGDWEITRIEGTQNRFRLRSDSFKNRDAFATQRDADSVSNLTVEAVVRADGMILQYKTSYERTTDGKTLRITFGVEHTDVGKPVSIGEPEWVSNVNETDSERSGSQTATAPGETS